MANQDRFGTQEVGRQILRGLMGPCHVVPGWNDFGSTHSLRKFFIKFSFTNICFSIRKLTRQNNGCGKNSLSVRDVVILAWGGTQPQQNLGEVGCPRGARQAGSQGSVEVLIQAVGLQMVGGGLPMPDAQDVAEAVPEG
jgi:hypothetical protein